MVLIRDSRVEVNKVFSAVPSLSLLTKLVDALLSEEIIEHAFICHVRLSQRHNAPHAPHEVIQNHGLLHLLVEIG